MPARLEVEVIDASVVVEWFTPRDTDTRGLALAVLDAIRDRPEHFAVPSLMYHEVHAVLCRKLGRSEAVDGALDAIWRLGLITMPWDPAMAKAAARLAFAWGLSGSDATYLALAESLPGVWVTFDARAHSRIESLGLSRVLAP